MKKLSAEKKTLIINGVFSLVVLAAFLPVSIIFPHLWGLSIGWLIGATVTLINMLLLFKTGYAISEAAKNNKGVGMSVAFSGLRFLLIGAAMIICAVLQYTTSKDFHYFDYSVFTCAASALPMSLILVIFYKEKDKGEENK